MAEPSIPAWPCEGDAWQSLDCSPSDPICRHQWDWFNGRPSGSAPCDQPVDALRQQYRHGDEADRLKAAYSMGTHGEEGVLVLMDELRQEAEDKTALNLQKDHTNPCQFDAAYGLVAAGTDAMPTLIEALDDSEWAVRASAADILGDMGTLAAHTTPQLIKALNDSSLWVRRNAAEALGIFGVEAKDAVPALSRTLSDQNARVRLNAVSALQRIGPAAETAVDRLRQTLQDETYFIRAHAQIALDRIHVIS
ncbi:MAG TPA: HEAT repeat domain-containing protein [candidate division Zixibacteria bacterium]|nr:HEAT repeat domain-containing protein [candidate division Zixibacteria bacterium]